MKMQFLILVGLTILASIVLTGCSSSESAVDQSVPLGKNTDKFKPTSVSAAGGGSPKTSTFTTPSTK